MVNSESWLDRFGGSWGVILRPFRDVECAQLIKYGVMVVKYRLGLSTCEALLAAASAVGARQGR